MDTPLHPEVVVDLTGQEAKPVACLAMVRRALQKAGHDDSARSFTDRAFSRPNEELFEIADHYVTLIR